MTTVKILIVVNIFDRYNKKNLKIKYAGIFPDHDINNAKVSCDEAVVLFYNSKDISY